MRRGSRGCSRALRLAGSARLACSRWLPWGALSSRSWRARASSHWPGSSQRSATATSSTHAASCSRLFRLAWCWPLSTSGLWRPLRVSALKASSSQKCSRLQRYRRRCSRSRMASPSVAWKAAARRSSARHWKTAPRTPALAAAPHRGTGSRNRWARHGDLAVVEHPDRLALRGLLWFVAAPGADRCGARLHQPQAAFQVADRCQPGKDAGEGGGDIPVGRQGPARLKPRPNAALIISRARPRAVLGQPRRAARVIAAAQPSNTPGPPGAAAG
ncbi:hypothetical protein PBOI14_42600 [Pseudomonas sp. Boi14]|nr:hypothetical protein PBOI14_42600 [Pseudomonas sp. Boi14]